MYCADQNADKRINSAMNWPTSYRNLVRFGAVTPEFTRLECVYPIDESSKLAYPADYLSSYLTDLHRIFRTG